jgi:ribosomal protein S18 acetylase RimI-like enzyme
MSRSKSRRVHVRDATDADREGLEQVSRETTATLRQVYRPTVAARAHRAAEEPNLHTLVALDGELIVGSVYWKVVGARLHLLGLGVGVVHRRKGVSRSLVEHLVGIAQELGLSGLSLYTVRETGNVAIFERLGFRIRREGSDATLESDRFATLTEVSMELDL